MNELLNKEPVKRVQKKLLEFDASYKVMVLASSARTAQEAAESYFGVEEKLYDDQEETESKKAAAD